MPFTVYRATRDVTVAYTTDYERALEKRREAIERFLDRNCLPQDTGMYARDEGTGKIHGISRGSTIPTGWRVAPQQPEVILPDRRTKIGRQISEELAAIPHANGRRLLPGRMPDHCVTERTLMHPSVEVFDGRLFVGWPRALPDKINNLLASTVWEQVPLSTYHLAKETET